MRILQIEDDSATAQSVELMLKSEGMNVYSTDLGEEGVDLAKVYDYDLITLDLNLPDISGFDVLRQIRAAKIGTPIMILSGTSDRVPALVKALNAGADDYMSKPFHKDELVARIHAVVRRSKGHAESAIMVGDIRVDLARKVVSIRGVPVPLTGKEYAMVELLALRKGTTLTKDAFVSHLYGGMDEPELKIVDVFICNLRKKLSAFGAPGHVQTVWGRGYVMRDEPQVKRDEPLPAKPREQLETSHGMVLRCLADDGDATVGELIQATRRNVYTVRTIVTALMGKVLIVNVGQHKAAKYRLTQAGHAWLVKHGYEPVQVAA